MSSGFHADPGVLSEIACVLGKSADQLDIAGSSAPATPDAGNATPAVAAILAKLVGDAGELVVATEAAGEAVSQGGKAYSETDQRAQESINAVGPN